MKKMNLILGTTFLLFLIYACNKLDTPPLSSLPKNFIEKATIEEKRVYRNSNLTIIGNTLGRLIKKDPEFLTYLKNQANMSKDDYNVLIKTLMSSAKYSSYFKNSDFLAAYKAFINLDGQNWEPQIYFPHLAYIENNTALLTPENDDPVFVVFNGDDAITKLPGYILNEDGNLVLENSLIVDEEYFEANDVLVLGLNENSPTYLPDTTNYVDTIPCPDVEVTGRFEKMTIKDHKESIFAGKSDIAIVRKSRFANPGGSNPITQENTRWDFTKEIVQVDPLGNSVCELSLGGELIRQFTRKEIRNKTSIAINWSYYYRWAPLCGSPSQKYITSLCQPRYNEIKGDALYYLIFEKDGWPAGRKEARITNPVSGNPVDGETLYYRSEQSAYYYSYINYSESEQIPVQNSVFNLSVSHPWIDFNSKGIIFR